MGRTKPEIAKVCAKIPLALPDNFYLNPWWLTGNEGGNFLIAIFDFRNGIIDARAHARVLSRRLFDRFEWSFQGAGGSWPGNCMPGMAVR